MDKRKVKVVECVEGDIVASDVFYDSGTAMITQNTKINEYIIAKLMSLGVDEIEIYQRSKPQGQTEQEVASEYEKNYSKLEKVYSENVKDLKRIMNKIVNWNELDHQLALNIVDNLYNEIENKGHIIRCLSSFRDLDQYTYNHSVNVALYSMLLGQWLNLNEQMVREVTMAGLLHDVGKSKIPDEILNKRGLLSSNEFSIVKTHSAHGYEIARIAGDLSKDILNGILMHHEKYDGSGYPLGAKGREISLYARIISVADVYDAITSDRVYKKRLTPFDTFKLFETTGFGQFDAKIMITFLHNIASYYVGSNVWLDNGEVAQIVYISPHKISEPVLKIEDSYIDMSKEKKRRIVAMVD